MLIWSSLCERYLIVAQVNSGIDVENTVQAGYQNQILIPILIFTRTLKQRVDWPPKCDVGVPSNSWSLYLTVAQLGRRWLYHWFLYRYSPLRHQYLVAR